MNFLEVGRQISVLNKLADSYHCDLIDNKFAPTFGLPTEFIMQVKSISSLPIDVHLMVDDVERTVEMLLQIGVDVITLPVERISSNAFRLIGRIKDAQVRIGVALNPLTSLEDLTYVLPILDKVTVLMFDPGIAGQKLINAMFSKVSALVEARRQNGYGFDIEVDGSCNKQNFKGMSSCGADQFVVGASGLFTLDEDIEIAWRKMKDYMND